MPKKIYTEIKIPKVQPDACWDCPCLGQIPKEERQHGSQETLVCLASHHAMSARFAKSKASEHDTRHPHHRPCDSSYERWLDAPYYGRLPVRSADVSRYRDPFERDFMQFRIIFHDRGRKPKPH